MARPTLPTLVTADLQAEDYYETTLAQPLAAADTDIYPETMPSSDQAFGVIDPLGDAPEIVFWNSQGANFVRCPSATDGQGRGVFQTTPQDWDSGTTFGVYTVSAYLEAIVTGVAMQDEFLQARHFSSAIDPNSWVGTGEEWTYGVNNGQREYTYIIAGDKTAKYSKGMRVRLPRVTNVGYGSLPLVNASSQYAKKTSPAGISFTDDFTIEALIYLNSYTAGTIASKYDGSHGFRFNINATGQLIIRGDGSSNREYTGRRSIPLKRWVHVAATLDMSGNLATVYYDGIAGTPDSTGSTGTSLIQAGNLEIGSQNAGNFFDGKIADVRIWSVVRTQQNIKDNMHKRLAGSETNLVAYFKLAADLNDSTSNANNLTGQAGAAVVAGDSQAASPFLSTEWGIIHDIVYATGNTTITLYTGVFNAPAEDLSNVSYSGAKIPVGFPVDSANWMVITTTATIRSTTSTSFATLLNTITVPTGAWELSMQTSVSITLGGSSGRLATFTLSSDASTETDIQTTCTASSSLATSGEARTNAFVKAYINKASATTYILMGKVGNALHTANVSPSSELCTLRAISAYL